MINIIHQSIDSSRMLCAIEQENVVCQRERESTFHISYFLVEEICHVDINRRLTHNCNQIDFHGLEPKSTLHAVEIFTLMKTSDCLQLKELALYQTS